MLFSKKIGKFIIICTSLFMFIGCNESNKIPKMDSVIDSLSTPADSKKAESNASKYDQNVQAESSIDTAIELSQKYALLTEESAKIKETNRTLTEENQKLKENVTALQTQLDQTKKELTEANDLLVEMRIELNNWKTDILGFRDEMRDAQKAQLEALIKVLTILGGQTVNFTAAETTAPEETVQQEVIQQETVQTENVQSPNEPNDAAENSTQQENVTENTTGQENG